ncbi:MAG: hypothetical protein Q7J32_04355, partial [Sphingomonadaceae bacterium]|nr:hypothetical protein [Sphingomonadaceae bacterium]
MGKKPRSGAARPAGEGERAARRGLAHQDRSSARLIYEALDAGALEFVGLADTAAGAFDDLVLGVDGEVVAHQFKKALQPRTVGLTQLLLGRHSGIAAFARDHRLLAGQFSDRRLRLRFLSNDRPATADRLLSEDNSSTADFLRERDTHPGRSLADWRATRWTPYIDRLVKASALAEPEFERFWAAFDIVLGPAAEPALGIGEDPGRAQQVDELAQAIGGLIADNPATSRWSRGELLDALGWPDRTKLRFEHRFPVGAYVQRNAASEEKLAAAIAGHAGGYVSLVGAPGTGKSTLLQRLVRSDATIRVLRYLAYVPGGAQGQGRGEADYFYDDLNSQLVAVGLKALRYKNSTRLERQQAFEHLLGEA